MQCVDYIYTSQEKLHHDAKKPITNNIWKRAGGGGGLECLPELKEVQMWLIWHILIPYRVPSKLIGS
jgi:hypothetical protein